MIRRMGLLAWAAAVGGAGLLLGGCGSVAKKVGRPDEKPPRDLPAELRAADRVELFRPGFGSQPQATRQLGNRDAVEDFIRNVPVMKSEATEACDCSGGYALRFYSGSTLQAELSVHHGRAVRWKNGAWPGDAFLLGRNRSLILEWVARNGGESMPALGRAKPLSDFVSPEPEQVVNGRFLACFPEQVQTALRWKDLAQWTFEPRLVANDLLQEMPDRVALAGAGFRALGGLRRTWLLDDMKTGMVQTAVASLDEETWRAALSVGESSEDVLRGAARIYFRFGLERQFSAEFNRQWLDRLAQIAMSTGTDHERALMIVYLGRGGAAGRDYLRRLASVSEVHAWPTSCGGFDDTFFEPSLSRAVAIVLALHGEPVSLSAGKRAGRAVLDEPALRLILAINDETAPLDADLFLHRSHILGYAAAEVLARRSAGSVSLAAVESGLTHPDPWVVQRVLGAVHARGIGGLDRHGWTGQRFTSVPESLVADHPEEAVRRCTAALAEAKDGERGRLLVLRASAHSRMKRYTSAILDLQRALSVLGVDPIEVRMRLVWLEWYQGNLAEVLSHADMLVKQRPTAEILLLRGMARFARGQIDGETELDFSAAMRLDPDNGYARIFQHLTTCLAGTEERSRLSEPTMVASEVREEWTPLVRAFFEGKVSAAKLQAQAHEWNMQPQLVAEAHFYRAQKARLEGDSVVEKEQLQSCLATGSAELIEYQMAKSRLAEL